jgi:hypothetical protein
MVLFSNGKYSRIITFNIYIKGKLFINMWQIFFFARLKTLNTWYHIPIVPVVPYYKNKNVLRVCYQTKSVVVDLNLLNFKKNPERLGFRGMNESFYTSTRHFKVSDPAWYLIDIDLQAYNKIYNRYIYIFFLIIKFDQ